MTHNWQWFSWGRGTGKPWGPWPANITNKKTLGSVSYCLKKRGEGRPKTPKVTGQILTFTHKVYMNTCIYTYYFQNNTILSFNSLLAKIHTGYITIISMLISCHSAGMRHMEKSFSVFDRDAISVSLITQIPACSYFFYKIGLRVLW